MNNAAVQLRHDGYRPGQLGRAANVPCAASPQNSRHRTRSENHRGCRHRVSEESARRDYPDHVFVVRVRADGSANLHGSANAEVYQKVPVGRILGQPDGRKLGLPHVKRK